MQRKNVIIPFILCLTACHHDVQPLPVPNSRQNRADSVEEPNPDPIGQSVEQRPAQPLEESKSEPPRVVLSLGPTTPPEEASTLEDNRKNRPNWDNRDVVQYKYRSKFFDEAQPMEKVSLEGGMLVCAVTATQKAWDFSLSGRYAEPDFSFTVKLGRKNKDLTIVGPNNKSSTVFSMPAVHLKKADPIRIKVVDRDYRFHDFIGRTKLIFKGNFPIEAKGKNFSVECRGVKRQTLESTGETMWKVADEQLPFLSDIHPEEESLSYEFPEEESSDARRSLADLASLFGWGDPRLLPRLEFYRKEAVRYCSEVRSDLEKLVSASRTEEGWIAINNLEQARITKNSCLPRVVRRYSRNQWRNQCVSIVEIKGQAQEEPFLKATLMTGDCEEIRSRRIKVLIPSAKKSKKSPQSEKNGGMRTLVFLSQEKLPEKLDFIRLESSYDKVILPIENNP